MSGLIHEDEGEELASILMPEIAAQHPDIMPMAGAAYLLVEASKAGNGDLARRSAQLAAMLWEYGDEDVRADVVAGFFFGLRRRLDGDEPNDLLLESLTEEQRRHLRETRPPQR